MWAIENMHLNTLCMQKTWRNIEAEKHPYSINNIK